MHAPLLYHFEKFCPNWLATTLSEKKLHCSDREVKRPMGLQALFHQQELFIVGPSADFYRRSNGDRAAPNLLPHARPHVHIDVVALRG